MSNTANIKPTKTRVMLVSEGLEPPTFTLHHYQETRQTTITIVSENHPPQQVQALEHIFKCFRTGATRRFGCDRLPEEGFN